MGWTAICTIPDDNGNNCDLFTQFGMLNRQNMVNHANTYMGNDVRDKQNSAQMAVCIMASLDNAAQLTMQNASEDYVINDEANGPLMLFEVIKRATINVRASTSVIMSQLIGAANLLREKEYDIKAFNGVINGLLFELRARGETCPEAVHYLFRAYEQAPDDKFTTYIAG